MLCLVSQRPPLNQHGQYTIDLILLVSPTGNKDGVTIGRHTLPCCIWDVLTLPPPREIQARKSWNSFPIFKQKNILLGKSPLPNVPTKCADSNSIRACPKDRFCHLYSWQMAFHFICTHQSQQDLKQSMQILILNPGPESPLLPNFTFFSNAGHCFNSSNTGCCRCPILTAAILLMLCSTGCPVLLCFKT